MIVDTAVHPLIGDAELRELMGAPWSHAPLANVLGSRYGPPFDDLSVSLTAAADPGVAASIMRERGVTTAILTPLTRGLYTNPQVGEAHAHAANVWLRERWLGESIDGVRFLGSIRIHVLDAERAKREIAAFADDARFVQLAVPLRSLSPYGDERYFPIWREAAERDLPVYVLDDLADAVEPIPTPLGYPPSFAEHHTLKPFASLVHASSLVTAGVFERLPNLRFVFGNGGVDLFHPLFWRVDKDWRAGRVEIPWLVEAPSRRALDHIRFVTQPEDCRGDGRTVSDDLVALCAPLLLFGSRWPFWDSVEPATLLVDASAGTRDRVLSENAHAIYPRLQAVLPAG